MLFIYVLAGWGASAADSRVLRDVVSWRNGLKIPHNKRITVKNGIPCFAI